MCAAGADIASLPLVGAACEHTWRENKVHAELVCRKSIARLLAPAAGLGSAFQAGCAVDRLSITV